MKNKKKAALLIALGILALCAVIYAVLIFLEANAPSEGGYGTIEQREDGITVVILTEIAGDSEVKTIRVVGLADAGFSDDPAVEELLNANLYEFLLWGGFTREAFDAEAETPEIDYAIVGNYISVRAYDTEYTPGAAYPVNRLRTIVLNLETGEYAGWPFDYLRMDSEQEIDALQSAFTSGSFVQIHPETPVEGAAEELAEALGDSAWRDGLGFYLTDDSLGIYLTGLPHAVGDYWVFEAKYSDIEPLLTRKLLDAL